MDSLCYLNIWPLYNNGMTGKKELLSMYLQDTTLDLVFQLQSQNLMAETTYNQLKDKLRSLCRHKIPLNKTEMEISMIQMNQDEPIDSYFSRLLRAIRHKIPEATDEQKVHF